MVRGTIMTDKKTKGRKVVHSTDWETYIAIKLIDWLSLTLFLCREAIYDTPVKLPYW